MGSFEEDKDIIKQNLECVTERPDAVFGIRMLMEDKCEMPDRETVQDVMDRHLGRSECFCYDAQVIGFSASQYSVHFAKENKDISPQLLIMGCKPITAPVMDGMEKSQTWDCPECDDILQQCTWQVAASDMMAAGLNYKERAEMLVQYVEALMELFPSCRAVVQFQEDVYKGEVDPMPAADGVSFYLLCSECPIVQYSGSRGYDCGFCGNEHVVFAGYPVSFSWCESQCGCCPCLSDSCLYFCFWQSD